MSIFGHKPNGYSLTFTGDGVRVEGETRQCIHCSYAWQYAPGSGARRGYCLHCFGLICGRAECAVQQAQIRATYPSYGCMPWDDYIRRELERIAREEGLELTPAGLLVPKGLRGDPRLLPPGELRP